MHADWRDTGEMFGVNGHRISPAEHKPAMTKDDSLIATIVFLPVLVTIGMAWWVIRHPATTAVLAVLAVVWQTIGLVGLIGATAMLCGGLVTWHHKRPASFERFVSDRFRTTMRGWWTYRRRWHATMTLTGLNARVDGTAYEPDIRKLRCHHHTDCLQIRLLNGQEPRHWDLRTEALAHTFGALACRVRDVDKKGQIKKGRIWLDFIRVDTLADTIPALPIPATADQVDLSAVPVGKREDGHAWTLRLVGSAAAHLLIAGASGSGKSGLLWSLIRGIAPCIKAGSVQIHAVDPKGGMELAPGHMLYTRSGYGDPEQMAAIIADAETLVHQRTRRLREAGKRSHTPTVDDPLVVMIIDEIASLTSYLADRQLAKQMAASLSVVLSQGRAAGVVVVGAVQDPRKDVVSYRDLFPVRVGLRMTEATQADMVLGEKAYERGARCEEIGDNAHGTGYVRLEGRRDLVRVRGAKVTDDDIKQLAHDYAAPLSDLEDAAGVDVDVEFAAILNPGHGNGQQ
jgi:S-DNA-T family DNA segregation ATPase FtsK/SpoIIIE